MTYLLHPALLILGLFLLVRGANILINSAEIVAERLGVPHAIIGALILGFGTSLPELAISVASSISGTPEIAYGNAIGSNIANSGLILGMAALLSTVPVVFSGRILRDQLLLNCMATLLFVGACLFGSLGTWQALLFLTAFVFSVGIILRDQLQNKLPKAQTGNSKTKPSSLVLNALFGLACIVVASRLTIIGASGSARMLGVSEQIIALSVVAFGTSLPELVITVRLAIKNQSELILGNLLGSNIFNLLLVLPVAHLFTPIALSKNEFLRDGGALSLITLLVFFFCFSWAKERKLGRLHGGVLLALYLAYIILLTQKGASAL